MTTFVTTKSSHALVFPIKDCIANRYRYALFGHVARLLTPRSAPSLGVYYIFVVDSVCLFVTLLQIDSSFFISRWNRAIFHRHFSMCHSAKRCSSIFDLGPLTPKIYSPKLALWTWVIELVIVHMDECHGSVTCAHKDLHVGGADPCCHGNDIWARRGV